MFSNLQTADPSGSTHPAGARGRNQPESCFRGRVGSGAEVVWKPSGARTQLCLREAAGLCAEGLTALDGRAGLGGSRTDLNPNPAPVRSVAADKPLQLSPPPFPISDTGPSQLLARGCSVRDKPAEHTQGLAPSQFLSHSHASIENSLSQKVVYSGTTLTSYFISLYSPSSSLNHHHHNKLRVKIHTLIFT